MENSASQHTAVKRVARSPVYIALGVVVFSFLVHSIGNPMLGIIILPLHFVALMAGIMEGATIGLLVGALMPVLNFLLFGMPPFPVFIFMTIEVATYGFISGLLNKKNIYLDLLVSMLIGRGVYMVAYYTIGLILNINLSPLTSILMSYVFGIPGIILQLIFIPMIVKRMPFSIRANSEAKKRQNKL
ncbi:MAG: Signal transduction histidine kinase, LytS [Petrotoga mobilis]|nr:MAG: Signal transduction histidine kinase, LytS [Petrotoga mobilis]